MRRPLPVASPEDVVNRSGTLPMLNISFLARILPVGLQLAHYVELILQRITSIINKLPL